MAGDGREGVDVTLTTVNLRVEATVEARRLANARALLRDGDERAASWLEGDATWIAMPRRASLKRTLGARLCLVWRVAFEDGSGRLVESKLVPVLVELRRGNAWPEQIGDPRDWIQSLLDGADGLIRARVESSCDPWRAEVVGIAAAFSSARRRRAGDVPGPTEERRVGSQPGLFDRRAERSREAEAPPAGEAERLAAERGHAIAMSAEISPRPARLLLVIAPSVR